jgi:hypothetical protein
MKIISRNHIGIHRSAENISGEANIHSKQLAGELFLQIL